MKRLSGWGVALVVALAAPGAVGAVPANAAAVASPGRSADNLKLDPAIRGETDRFIYRFKRPR